MVSQGSRADPLYPSSSLKVAGWLRHFARSHVRRRRRHFSGPDLRGRRQHVAGGSAMQGLFAMLHLPPRAAPRSKLSLRSSPLRLPIRRWPVARIRQPIAGSPSRTPAGAIKASSSAAITAFANPQGLKPGVYSADVAITITPSGAQPAPDHSEASRHRWPIQPPDPLWRCRKPVSTFQATSGWRRPIAAIYFDLERRVWIYAVLGLCVHGIGGKLAHRFAFLRYRYFYYSVIK